MNAKIDKEENIDINHRVRHAIQLTKNWIKRPFKLDLIPQTIVFQATTHPVKGRRENVTMPTFTTLSLVRPEIVHQLEKEFGYFRT